MTKRWKEISLAFTPQLQAEWAKHGFTYNQTKEWINAGMKPTEAEYAYWLTNIVALEPLTVLNEGDDEALKEQFSYWKANNPHPISHKQPWTWKLILTVLILALFTYYLLK